MASDRPILAGSSSLGLHKAARRPSDTDDSLSTQSGLPLFIAKLWNIVENPKTDNLIRWNAKGDAFVVPDPPAFSRVLLPQYFKHRNMASFIRVLNMYGFRKKPRLDGNSLRNVSDEMEFVNSHFKRGFHQDLRNISRKVSGREPKAVRVQETEVKQMLEELGELRGQQNSADLRLTDLKSENENLWTELQDLRRRHQTQQAVVHKLINFLAALVRPSGGRGIFLRATGPHAALTQESNDLSSSQSAETALAPFQPGTLASASESLLSLLSSCNALGAESPAMPRRLHASNSLTGETNEEGPTVEDLFDNGGGLDGQQQQAEMPPSYGSANRQEQEPPTTGATGSGANLVLPVNGKTMVPKGHRRGRTATSASTNKNAKVGQHQAITRGVFHDGGSRGGTSSSPSNSVDGATLALHSPRLNNSGGTMAVISSDRTTSRLPAQALHSLDLTPHNQPLVSQQKAGPPIVERNMPPASRNAKLFLRPQQSSEAVSQAILPVNSSQQAIVRYPLHMPPLGASGMSKGSQQQVIRHTQEIASPYRQPTFANSDMLANQTVQYQVNQPNSNTAGYANTTYPSQATSIDGDGRVAKQTTSSGVPDLKGVNQQLNNMQNRLESIRGSLSQQLSTPEDDELFNKLFGIEDFSDTDLHNAANSLIGNDNADGSYYNSSFGDVFNGEGSLNLDERGNFIVENGDDPNTYGGDVVPSNTDGQVDGDVDNFDSNAVNEAFEFMQNATPSSSRHSTASAEGTTANIDADTADDEIAQLIGGSADDEELLNSGRVIQHDSTLPSGTDLRSPLKTPDVRLPADMHAGMYAAQQRPTFSQVPSAVGYNRDIAWATSDANANVGAPVVAFRNPPKATSVNSNAKRKLLQTTLPNETAPWGGPSAKRKH